MDWGIYVLDALVVAIGIILVYKGYKKGLVNQIVWALSVVLGYLLASRVASPVAKMINLTVISEPLSLAMCFVLTMLMVMLVLYLVGAAITKTLDLTVAGIANSVLGALLNGVIYAVIIMSILNVSVLTFPSIHNYLGKTIVLNQLLGASTAILNNAGQEWIGGALQKMK